MKTFQYFALALLVVPLSAPIMAPAQDSSVNRQPVVAQKDALPAAIGSDVPMDLRQYVNTFTSPSGKLTFTLAWNGSALEVKEYVQSFFQPTPKDIAASVRITKAKEGQAYTIVGSDGAPGTAFEIRNLVPKGDRDLIGDVYFRGVQRGVVYTPATSGSK